jgi:thioredoxin reductase (NADPH)
MSRNERRQFQSIESKRIAVLGGGPAGLSAALSLARLGFEPIIVETADRLGGRHAASHGKVMLLGQPAISAQALVASWTEHIQLEGITVALGSEVTRIAGEAGAFEITLASKAARTFDAAAVVLAMGTRYRLNDARQNGHIEGAAEAMQAGRLRYGPPPPPMQMAAYCGRRVMVLGAGDEAFLTAVQLASVASVVYLVYSNRTQAQAMSQVALTQAIREKTVLRFPRHEVVRITPSSEGVAVQLRERGGELQNIEADVIFCQYGHQASTEQIAAMLPLELDDAQCVIVDAEGRASVSGIYAAGGICDAQNPSLVTAMAGGALVARTIERDFREAMLAYADLPIS